jgi:hypothetical protein
MDSLLQEINMLPGVLGCFVYNDKQQIAGNKMPPIFKENSIRSIGNLLTRTVQMANMAQLNFTGIEIKYNESLLLANPLAGGALLIIICEPSINQSLVKMTTGMLTKDLEASMSMGSTPATRAARQKTPATNNSPAPKQAPKDAEISAELAPILEQVKEALALAIGPIAAPVMKDSIELWATQQEPSIANIPALAKILCQEINDVDLEEDFMAELKNIKF